MKLNKFKMRLKHIKKKSSDKKAKQKKTHINLDRYLSKAGINMHSRLLSKGLFKMAIGLNLVLTIYLIFFFVKEGVASALYFVFIIFVLWVFVFFLFLALLWLLFYFFLDIKIFKRKLVVEEVLPDFLFLAATNIRAGMTVDKAMWFAIRPRFGVLSKEIETVAKEVMSGTELTEALEKFAKKYESDTLNRSINLLVQGIKSGGEIGDLLNKVALNIQEARLIKQEMAANVTTYVIFITFAAIVAAPCLLALSGQLIVIIGEIVSKIDMPSSGSMTFAISGISIPPKDFTIFAISSLSMTSFFSAIIISTIKKGNVKEGMKSIPIFIAVSVGIYLAASFIMGRLLGGLFT